MHQQSLTRGAIVAVRGSLPRLAQTVETRQHQLLSDEVFEFGAPTRAQLPTSCWSRRSAVERR